MKSNLIYLTDSIFKGRWLKGGVHYSESHLSKLL